jgi:hypothetical protein
MPIYVIEKDTAIVAVVEAWSQKGAIVEHAESEGISARVATKEDLFQYMRLGGALPQQKPADENQQPLPLPEPALPEEPANLTE